MSGKGNSPKKGAGLRQDWQCDEEEETQRRGHSQSPRRNQSGAAAGNMNCDFQSGMQFDVRTQANSNGGFTLSLTPRSASNASGSKSPSKNAQTKRKADNMLDVKTPPKDQMKLGYRHCWVPSPELKPGRKNMVFSSDEDEDDCVPGLNMDDDDDDDGFFLAAPRGRRGEMPSPIDNDDEDDDEEMDEEMARLMREAFPSQGNAEDILEREMAQARCEGYGRKYAKATHRKKNDALEKERLRQGLFGTAKKGPRMDLDESDDRNDYAEAGPSNDPCMPDKKHKRNDYDDYGGAGAGAIC